MKRVSGFLLTLVFLVHGGLAGEEKSRNDLLENLVIIQETEPVPDRLKPGFDSIRETDLSGYLGFIASDFTEGRDTASRGFKIAAEFISALFTKWGVEPAGDRVSSQERRSFFDDPTGGDRDDKKSYFQKVILKEYLDQKSTLTVRRNDEGYSRVLRFDKEAGLDVFCRENLVLEAGVVFVGFGLEEKGLKFNEYRGVDVRGKFVMMFKGLPRADRKDSPFTSGVLKEKYAARGRRGSDFSKYKVAKDKGAVGIILIDDSVVEEQLEPVYPFDEKPLIPGKRRSMSLLGKSEDMPWNQMLRISTSSEISQEIISMHSSRDLNRLKENIEDQLRPASFELKNTKLVFENRVKFRIVHSHNVLGILKGSDPDLSREVVILGAHLDHLGKRGDYVYNGADDNGSGSVAVMEIAEALSMNGVRPRRSVMFALWTGEEKGLLGSRYYVQNPVFPLDKTVACLNLDMISRNYSREGLKKMATRMFKMKEPDEILSRIDIQRFISPSVAESAPDLAEVIKTNNKHVGLHIFLRPSRGGMGGSDHAPFSMKRVPWAFFMAGFTRDYHQPTDSIGKVNFRLLRDITRLTYLTAFNYADK